MVELKRIYQRKADGWEEQILSSSQSAICDANGEQIDTTYQTKEDTVEEIARIDDELSAKQPVSVIGAGDGPSDVPAGQVWMKETGDDGTARMETEEMDTEDQGPYVLKAQWIFSKVPVLGNLTLGGPRQPVYIENGAFRPCDPYPDVPDVPDVPDGPATQFRPAVPSLPAGRTMTLGVVGPEDKVYSFSYADDLAGKRPVRGSVRVDTVGTSTVARPRLFDEAFHGNRVDAGLSNKDAYALQVVRRARIADGASEDKYPLLPAHPDTHSDYTMDVGDWTDDCPMLAGMYVCMVDDAGRTVHVLDPNDYSVGVEESVGDDGERTVRTYPVPADDFRRYQVMLAIPKVYVRRGAEGITVGDEGGAGFSCLAHTLKCLDENGDTVDREFDELLVGMYPTVRTVIDGRERFGSYSSYALGIDGHGPKDYPDLPPQSEDWTGTSAPPRTSVVQDDGWERETGDVMLDGWSWFVGRRPVSSGASDGVHRYTRKDFRERYSGLNDRRVGACGYTETGGVWMQTNWHQYSLLRDLVVMAVKGFDSQHTVGYGYEQKTAHVMSNRAMAFNGMCDRDGWFFGDPYENISSQAQTDCAVPVKCLVENPWGNIWNYIDDMCVDPSYGILYGKYVADGDFDDGTVSVSKGDLVDLAVLEAKGIPYHDAVGVYAGYSHPDLIGRSGHDVQGVGQTMANDIPTVPVTEGADWGPTGSYGDCEWGTVDRSRVSEQDLRAYVDLVEGDHVLRDRIGDVDISWLPSSEGEVANPYVQSRSSNPTGISRSPLGWGLPSDIQGGVSRQAVPETDSSKRPTGRMNTVGGLGDDMYVRACHRGCPMWGGRVGHGNGSGIMSLALAPDLDNTSVHHGSRIVLLRNREVS